MTLDHCMAPATATISPPLQVRDEMAAFLDLAQQQSVRSYLEIGVRYGGMFEGVMNVLPQDAIGVAVDFPGGYFGDDGSLPFLMRSFDRMMSKGLDVSMILGPSGAPEVVERVFRRAPYDLIFIDADHSYEAVKRDFIQYSPMGRIIALHDIAAPDGLTDKKGSRIETGRFWREIRGEFHTEELIAPGSSMGIGIVWR